MTKRKRTKAKRKPNKGRKESEGNEGRKAKKGKIPKTYLEFLFGSHTPLLDILLQSADRVLSAPHALDFFTGTVGGSGV